MKKLLLSKMSRVLSVVLLSISLGWGAAYAQESTDAPTVEFVTSTPVAPTEVPPVETPVPDPPIVVIDGSTLTANDFLLIAFVVGILAAFVLLLRPLIFRLADSVPLVILEAMFSSLETLLRSVEEHARTTPNTADDALVAELRREFEALRDAIRDLKTAQPLAAALAAGGEPLTRRLIDLLEREAGQVG